MTFSLKTALWSEYRRLASIFTYAGTKQSKIEPYFLGNMDSCYCSETLEQGTDYPELPAFSIYSLPGF